MHQEWERVTCLGNEAASEEPLNENALAVKKGLLVACVFLIVGLVPMKRQIPYRMK